MQITMTETRRGSEDGFTVRRYMESLTYDVAQSMGAAFVNKGWARPTNPATFNQLGVML